MRRLSQLTWIRFHPNDTRGHGGHGGSEEQLQCSRVLDEVAKRLALQQQKKNESKTRTKERSLCR